MLKKNIISFSNIWKQLISILSNLNYFHSLEVVDRVGETQFQVGENSDWIIWRLKGLMADQGEGGGGVGEGTVFLPSQTIRFPAKKPKKTFSLIKNKLYFSWNVTDKLFFENMFNHIN